MKLLDSRRLTGANLYTDGSAAIAEVALDAGEDSARVIAEWRREVARMLAALGWPTESLVTRAWASGVALVIPAPIDRVLVATEVSEWAVGSVASILDGGTPSPLEPHRTKLAECAERDREPALIALCDAAAAHGLDFLVDDDEISLGHGARSRRWRRAQLPDPGEVAWDELGAIPIAMITGTNGKTTSARLVARIARIAGLHPGTTSTDGVSVGDATVEKGDWTGPAAARMVLRDPRVDLAVLETARGGILRRGLAVTLVDAALITNVSEDHLGDYFIDDVDAMAEVKAVVARAARVAVLNADDERLVALGRQLAHPIWFTLDPANPVVAAHRAAGGEAWLERDRLIVRAVGDREEVILPTHDVPITFRGAARYNVANALGAAALASVLGLPIAAIREGLATFSSSRDDNPGRGNLSTVRGVRVLVDFGHNPAGVRAVLAFAASLRDDVALTVIAGMPGDRPDGELDRVAAEIAAAHPTRVLLRDLDGYLRGKAPGEIPAYLTESLVRAGVRRDCIATVESEPAALRRALDASKAGDLVVLLAHIDTAGVAGVISDGESASSP